MSEYNKLIIGSGSGGGKGGGGGSARTATEDPNSLRSRQFARVIDLLCEGEIEGLPSNSTEAEKRIYLNGVPIRSEAGTPNFNLDGLQWYFVPGTQAQEVLPVGGTINAEVEVNQQVKYGNTGGGPVIRTIYDGGIGIDSIRVTVTVPRLTSQDMDDGDIHGTSVSFSVYVQTNSGGFVEVLAKTISGKTNSSYQRSYEFDLPKPTGVDPSTLQWDIRVQRNTPDSDTSNTQNDLYWSSYTKIVRDKLNYPNTALIGIKADSALFNSVPARAYKLKLLKVKIPSNYNPTTRSYTGLWDGTWASSTAWTDNPAWCWYDLITSERYGLGEYIDKDTIDKWTLYSIAQYCDELVPDGFGGTEPRFRCNLLLQTREDAIKVLMNMASIFRGIAYWHSNTVYCSQDKPADPVKLFTASNVINGEFNYSGTAKQARHTVALVSWNDPENLYKQTVEYVEDRESILKLGVREVEVSAMGCTSRGQAHRLGLWTLLTEREETETITFKTGLEGCGVMPGEIIKTTDATRSGKRMGGRVANSTSNSITIDSTVELQPGVNYTLSVILPSGTIQDKTVVWSGSQNTNVSELTVSSNWDQLPSKNAVWILQADNLIPELWRVMSATEVEPGIVELSALEHIPAKYAAIEQNITLQPATTTSLRLTPGVVSNITAVTDIKMLNALEYTTRILVSWTPPENSVRYVVTWRRNQDNPHTISVSNPTIDLDDVTDGTYYISIAAENEIGLRGPAVNITHVIDQSYPEPDITGLSLNPNFSGPDCSIKWDNLSWAIAYNVEVYSKDINNNYNLVRTDSVSTPEYTYTYLNNQYDNTVPNRYLKFKVKARSWRGISANWSEIVANNPAPSAPSVTIAEGPSHVSISANLPPNLADFAGFKVWMSTSDTGFIPDDSNLIYSGSATAFVKTGLVPNTPYFFIAAFYDSFGTTGINYSSIVSGTPQAAGGVEIVENIPTTAPSGSDQWVLYVNTGNTDTTGLYAWDSELGEWLFTRDGNNIIANSIAADKLTVTSLSAITANMGSITSGSLTLDTNGYIRGGATGFNAGNGIWIGYDSPADVNSISGTLGTSTNYNSMYFTTISSIGSTTNLYEGMSLVKVSGAGVLGNNAVIDKIVNSTQITVKSTTACTAGALVFNANGIDAYKWRVGDPAGTRVEWNGYSFNIKSSDSSVSFSTTHGIDIVGEGKFNMRSATTGQRFEMTEKVIKIYDENGVLRVRLGDLNA